MAGNAEDASKTFMLAAERTNTLYALSDEYTHLVDLLEDPDVDPAMLEAELDRVGEQIVHKAEAIAGLIRWFEGLAALRKAEAKRMADTVGTYQHRADWLRAYVLRQMETLEVPKIETGRFTLAVRQNPPRVEVLNDAEIETSFLRHIPEQWEPNKKAILEHYKRTGEIPPGVDIVRGTRLDIG
jgi:hypothetical protein